MTTQQRLTMPTSVRFTPDERARIDEMTLKLGVTLTELVRLRLFSKDFEKSVELLTMKKTQRQELAQILAALG